MRLIAGVFTLFLLCCGCSPKEPSSVSAVASKPPEVAVAKASRQDLVRKEVLAAEFRPFQEIDVHAKVAGFIKKMYVDAGDRVKTGQTLAVLEIPEMADELARAQASRSRSVSEVQREQDEVTRAEAGHQATHVIYERLSGVAKTRPNLIAQQEIDDAQAKDQAAEAQVSAAKSALASARDAVAVSQADVEKTKTMNAYANITAPFAGIITKRYADTGAMIPASTSSSNNAAPIVRLAQNDLLRLFLPVPEALSGRVHVGLPVEVKVSALGRTFEGKVTRMADMVTTATRTMDAQVDVPNPRGLLIPGMYAEGIITIDRRPDALAVPLGAVITGTKGSTVYLVGPDGKVVVRPVQLGLETPDKVQVLSGLQEGDLVITGNRGQITPGQQVEAKLIGSQQ